MSREYTMMMGKDSWDYFDALIKHQYQPTEATKKRIDAISEKITKDLTESQNKKEVRFVELYSSELLEFIRSLFIDDKYFLVGKDAPFSLSWSICSDENDNYWAIDFNKGQFKYVCDICGGYAGTEVIEENISRERVLELLNDIQNDEPSVATGAK